MANRNLQNNGGQHGRVGTAISTSWKGRKVLRAYQPNVANPRTLKQRQQRARFTTLARLCKGFREALMIGLATYADELRITCYNAFHRCNMMRVDCTDPDNVGVDLPNIDLTGGSALPEVLATIGGTTADAILFDVAPLARPTAADACYADASDTVCLVAYCQHANNSAIVATPRGDAAHSVALHIPAAWHGMTLHLYCFAVGRCDGLNQGATTRTAYLGTWTHPAE